MESILGSYDLFSEFKQFVWEVYSLLYCNWSLFLLSKVTYKCTRVCTELEHTVVIVYRCSCRYYVLMVCSLVDMSSCSLEVACCSVIFTLAGSQQIKQNL
jgi:hypothetical protein